MYTKEILKKKKELLKGLADNIFKAFTLEEENILHSKHGYIKIIDCGCEGITGAFKVGMDLFIENDKIINTIKNIDWNKGILTDVNGEEWNFEFVPKSLEELL